MKTYSFVSSVPPKKVSQLWTLVNHIRCCNGTATLDFIVRKAEGTFGWTRKDTISYVEECVAGHLLLRASDRVKNGNFYSIPVLLEEVMEKDIYCFNCHQLGNVRNCTSCFRAFHTECLPENFSSAGMLLLCPSCQTHLWELNCEIKPLIKLLKPTLDSLSKKAGSCKLMNIPGRCSGIVRISPCRNLFVFIAHHMDLSIISMKLENGLYWKLCEFLSDVEIMVHNVNIIYGCNSDMTKTAERTFEEAKAATSAWDSGNMIDRGYLKNATAGLMLTRKRKRGSFKRTGPSKSGTGEQPTGSVKRGFQSARGKRSCRA
ncbi:Bromodomain domain containing protein [Trichuris trichiura]|uniref:Bromodomain domain containing protein n=1 Tax=Trichuris trichiura TaxID=36087 RepID=A0A077ZGC5_TRITR|nr:Bromodomain domain containing protein [Trichuris trichiura]